MDAKRIIDKLYWPLFILLMSILALLCFYKLGDYVILPWDELRHGLNAFEMLKKNNYLVNYAYGEVDYWNVKPPLHFYFVMLGYKIFGYNPLGLRFFSALAYLILTLIIALFLKKKTNKIASLLSIVILSVSVSFFYHHFVRHGDADSIFILFVGIALISLILSSENSNWLHLTGLMFALGFLTKATNIFILFPIIFFYYLFTKMYKHVKWWQYITSSICALLPILIWGIARYKFDGFMFIWEMIRHDFFKRTTQPLDNQAIRPFYYYIVELIKNPIQFTCLILFIALLIYKLIKKEKILNTDKLCLISILSIFILFSCATTKHEWYTYTSCIPLTIAGSISTVQIYNLLFKKKILQSIFCIGLGVVAFYCLVKTVIVIDNYQPHVINIQFITQKDNIKKEKTITSFFEYDDYFSNIENSFWPGNDILCLLEWQLNTVVDIKFGGYYTFIENKGSYLLIKKSNFETKNIPDYIQVVTSSNDYVFCYNALTE